MLRVSSPPLPVLIGAVVLLVALAGVLLWQEADNRDLEARISAVVGDDSRVGRRTILASVGAGLHLLGHTIRQRTRLYSEQDLAALGSMLGASGLNPGRMLPLVLGAKATVMVLVPVLAAAYVLVARRSPLYALLAAGAALPIGVLVPEWALRLLRGPYTRDLRRGAPDALDLLVVCTEAGMSLEAALDQVAREMRTSNRAMAAALATLVDELRVLPDRRQAFTNFGERSGVDGLRRMAAIIGQALQYGTPLGQALRAVAGELRRERLTRLEAKAVRLPGLLVFPLIFFILPALFIALMGSPMLHVLDTLGRR